MKLDPLTLDEIKTRVVCALSKYGHRADPPAPPIVAWAVSLIEACAITRLLHPRNALGVIEDMAFVHLWVCGDVNYTTDGLRDCLRRVVGRTVAGKLQLVMEKFTSPQQDDESDEGHP